MLWSEPCKIGDRVEINSNIGDVIDVGWLKFKIIEVSNRISQEQRLFSYL
ncbi:MAG: mechanosensitive ion channel family protein [Candidatus Niameybacter stercoravium]|nr:mechanosensitive ion channel family protein [Candidatus Niameybacter stercoravium]